MTRRRAVRVRAAPQRYPLAELAADAGAELRRATRFALGRPGGAASPTPRRATALPYDALLLALGARMRRAVRARDHDRRPPHGRGAARHRPGRRGRLRPPHRVRVAEPDGLAAADLRARAADARGAPSRWASTLEVTVVTPEAAPLCGVRRRARRPRSRGCSPRRASSTITCTDVQVPEPGRVVLQPVDRELAGRSRDRDAGAVRPVGPRPAGRRARLHPGRPALPGRRRATRVRGRRRHRLRDQAGRHRRAAGRRRRRGDRRARRRRRDAGDRSTPRSTACS